MTSWPAGHILLTNLKVSTSTSSSGCRIIDDGMFGQIPVRTSVKQKLAGTVFKQKPAGTVFEQKPAGTVL